MPTCPRCCTAASWRLRPESSAGTPSAPEREQNLSSRGRPGFHFAQAHDRVKFIRNTQVSSKSQAVFHTLYAIATSNKSIPQFYHFPNSLPIQNPETQNARPDFEPRPNLAVRPVPFITGGLAVPKPHSSPRNPESQPVSKTTRQEARHSFALPPTQ